MAGEGEMEMEVCSFLPFFIFLSWAVLWELSINRAYALLVIEQIFF